MMAPGVDQIAHELALIYAGEQLKQSQAVSDNDRIDFLNNAYNAAYQRISLARSGRAV